MPGRIRTIKPEILEDEKTAGLDDAAFRLFVALILLADDHGNGRATPKWLDLQIWWARDASRDIRESLASLSGCGLIQLYEADGQHYYHLPGWAKNQKVDHPSKGRVPAPPNESNRGVAAIPRETLAKPSRNPRESLAPDPIRSDPIRSDPTRPDPTPHTSRVRDPGSTNQEDDAPANQPEGASPQGQASVPRRCDPEKLQKTWLKRTKVIAADGLCEFARLVEEAAALCEPAADPDDYADRATVAFVDFARRCSPGRQPQLAPRKAVEHWARIQQDLASPPAPEAAGDDDLHERAPDEAAERSERRRRRDNRTPEEQAEIDRLNAELRATMRAAAAKKVAR